MSSEVLLQEIPVHHINLMRKNVCPNEKNYVLNWKLKPTNIGDKVANRSRQSDSIKVNQTNRENNSHFIKTTYSPSIRFSCSASRCTPLLSLHSV